MSREGLGFRLVRVELGYRGVLYTVQFEDSDETELERWSRNEEISRHPEFDGVFGAIEAIPYQGVPPGYFFKQEKYSGWVTPFVEEGYHELRLYCIRYERQNWVVAGNGCVKNEEGPLQQFDRCRRTFNEIRYVEERIARRLEGGDGFELIALDDRLEGDLWFPPESYR
ncbi:MAG: hypothetical protein V5A58_10940 [Salinibacter sp.]|jgi:hypothetical protein